MLDPSGGAPRRVEKAPRRCALRGCQPSRAACLHALNPAEAAAIRAYGLENPVDGDPQRHRPAGRCHTAAARLVAGGRASSSSAASTRRRASSSLTEAFARLGVNAPEIAAPLERGDRRLGRRRPPGRPCRRDRPPQPVRARVSPPAPLYGADKSGLARRRRAFGPAVLLRRPADVGARGVGLAPARPDDRGLQPARRVRRRRRGADETDPAALAATLGANSPSAPPPNSPRSAPTAALTSPPTTPGRGCDTHEAVYRWMVAGYPPGALPHVVSAIE